MRYGAYIHVVDTRGQGVEGATLSMDWVRLHGGNVAEVRAIPVARTAFMPGSEQVVPSSVIACDIPGEGDSEYAPGMDAVRLTVRKDGYRDSVGYIPAESLREAPTRRLGLAPLQRVHAVMERSDEDVTPPEETCTTVEEAYARYDTGLADRFSLRDAHEWLAGSRANLRVNLQDRGSWGYYVNRSSRDMGTFRDALDEVYQSMVPGVKDTLYVGGKRYEAVEIAEGLVCFIVKSLDTPSFVPWAWNRVPMELLAPSRIQAFTGKGLYTYCAPLANAAAFAVTLPGDIHIDCVQDGESNLWFGYNTPTGELRGKQEDRLVRIPSADGTVTYCTVSSALTYGNPILIGRHGQGDGERVLLAVMRPKHFGGWTATAETYTETILRADGGLTTQRLARVNLSGVRLDADADGAARVLLTDGEWRIMGADGSDGAPLPVKAGFRQTFFVTGEAKIEVKIPIRISDMGPVAYLHIDGRLSTPRLMMEGTRPAYYSLRVDNRILDKHLVVPIPPEGADCLLQCAWDGRAVIVPLTLRAGEDYSVQVDSVSDETMEGCIAVYRGERKDNSNFLRKLQFQARAMVVRYECQGSGRTIAPVSILAAGIPVPIATNAALRRGVDLFVRWDQECLLTVNREERVVRPDQLPAGNDTSPIVTFQKRCDRVGPTVRTRGMHVRMFGDDGRELRCEDERAADGATLTTVSLPDDLHRLTITAEGRGGKELLMLCVEAFWEEVYTIEGIEDAATQRWAYRVNVAVGGAKGVEYYSRLLRVYPRRAAYGQILINGCPIGEGVKDDQGAYRVHITGMMAYDTRVGIKGTNVVENVRVELPGSAEGALRAEEIPVRMEVSGGPSGSDTGDDAHGGWGPVPDSLREAIALRNGYPLRAGKTYSNLLWQGAKLSLSSRADEFLQRPWLLRVVRPAADGVQSGDEQRVVSAINFFMRSLMPGCGIRHFDRRVLRWALKGLHDEIAEEWATEDVDMVRRAFHLMRYGDTLPNLSSAEYDTVWRMVTKLHYGYSQAIARIVSGKGLPDGVTVLQNVSIPMAMECVGENDVNVAGETISLVSEFDYIVVEGMESGTQVSMVFLCPAARAADVVNGSAPEWSSCTERAVLGRAMLQSLLRSDTVFINAYALVVGEADGDSPCLLPLLTEDRVAGIVPRGHGGFRIEPLLANAIGQQIDDREIKSNGYRPIASHRSNDADSVVAWMGSDVQTIAGCARRTDSPRIESILSERFTPETRAAAPREIRLKLQDIEGEQLPDNSLEYLIVEVSEGLEEGSIVEQLRTARSRVVRTADAAATPITLEPEHMLFPRAKEGYEIVYPYCFGYQNVFERSEVTVFVARRDDTRQHDFMVDLTVRLIGFDLVELHGLQVFTQRDGEEEQAVPWKRRETNEAICRTRVPSFQPSKLIVRGTTGEMLHETLVSSHGEPIYELLMKSMLAGNRGDGYLH